MESWFIVTMRGLIRLRIDKGETIPYHVTTLKQQTHAAMYRNRTHPAFTPAESKALYARIAEMLVDDGSMGANKIGDKYEVIGMSRRKYSRAGLIRQAIIDGRTSINVYERHKIIETITL